VILLHVTKLRVSKRYHWALSLRCVPLHCHPAGSKVQSALSLFRMAAVPVTPPLWETPSAESASRHHLHFAMRALFAFSFIFEGCNGSRCHWPVAARLARLT